MPSAEGGGEPPPEPGTARPGLRRLLLADAAARGVALWWRPRGHCMRPTIGDGDRVLVAPLPPAGARLGDLLQYATPDGVRIHRLLARRGSGPDPAAFVLGGDNAGLPPEVVGSEAIFGRVIAVERAGRIRRLDTRAARLAALARVARQRIRPPGREPGSSTPSGVRGPWLLRVGRAALGVVTRLRGASRA